MNITELLTKSRPNLKPQSIKTYIANIRKISGTKEIEDLRFLNDPEEIFEKLEDLKLTMKRNILSSILVLITATQDFNVELYKIYSDKLLQFTTEYKKEIAKNEKTPTQEKNWTNMDTLSKITRKLLKEKPSSQNSLIASLYTMQAPQRLDYYDMELKGPKDELNGDKNYLIITGRNKKTFVFNDFKTSNKYNTVKIRVNKKLNSIINKFLKLHPERKYLLQNKDGDSMTRNSLGKTIPKIFSSTGKHVTLNLIRHMFVSENINIEQTKKQKEMANVMMHDTSMQLEYAKV